MSKAERTRNFILEKTAPVFNRKGFYGTSLTDLTEATGLTKGSLYGNFQDKEEIGEAAFAYAIAKVKGLVKRKLAAAASCKGQLLALLDFYSKYVFNPPIPGGCPMLNMAIESDDGRVAMRKAVSRELMETVGFISSLIRKGIRTGEFKKDVKPDHMAYVFFCAVEGALMFSRVERSKEPMDIVVKHCKELLNRMSSDH